MVAKQEFPPLLPLGFHSMDLAGVRALCVTRFPLSITRPSIMGGLDHVIGQLNGFGLNLEVMIDGSFVTGKLNPEDSDVAVQIDGNQFNSLPTAMQMGFQQFVLSDLKTNHRCDLYPFTVYPANHPLHEEGKWMEAYWINKFGFSRAEDPKGLARITIPYVVSP